MGLEPIDPNVKHGYCVFIDSVCGGRTPIVTTSDGKAGSKSRYVVFDTELEAQKEIVDGQMEKMRQFLESNGEERDYEDAMTLEEYILPVDVHSDGVITDEDGNEWGPEVK